MAVLVSDIRATAPEFATSPPTDAQIQTAIDEASAFVATRAWGSKTDIGVTALALHLLTLQARLADPAAGGAGGGSLAQGPITMRQDGQLTVMYAAPAGLTAASYGSGFDAWLSQTAYGQKYQFFARRIFAPRVLLP